VLVLCFQTLKIFRDEEMHHHDTGLKHDAEKVGNSASLYIL